MMNCWKNILMAVELIWIQSAHQQIKTNCSFVNKSESLENVVCRFDEPEIFQLSVRIIHQTKNTFFRPQSVWISRITWSKYEDLSHADTNS